MKKATRLEKELVIDILTQSFDANSSVNYIIKQDKKRVRRIRALMEYSFKVCYSFGKIFLSDDKSACALILFPDKRKVTIDTILADVKLMSTCIGINNMMKVLKRESRIRALQPNEHLCYLWFIGVSPQLQGRGIGSNLLREILSECQHDNRVICLETSTKKNIRWYEKFGFVIYDKLDLGYELFFMKKRITNDVCLYPEQK